MHFTEAFAMQAGIYPLAGVSCISIMYIAGEFSNPLPDCEGEASEH